MVYKCSAFGCKSGSTNNEDSGISFHRYPLEDKALLAKWIQNNPRKNFAPTNQSKLCSIHFNESDFINDSRDSNNRRKRSRTISSLQRRYLKQSAIPTIFPNAPKYLSSVKTERPTSTSTSAARLKSVNDRLENLETSFLQSDQIAGFSLFEINEKLRNESIPSDFITFVRDDNLYICSF